jgi:hypothetical protein
MKANFFLVGAAKCGTTALARLLETLPGAYLSPIKEPNHFCPDINAQTEREFRRQKLIDIEDYLERDFPRPIHSHQVERKDHYAKLFAPASDSTVVGECSTFYLPSHVAAKHIHEYNPDAKIMAVVRDPAARIKSHYIMQQRIGLERRTLEDCLDEELALGRQATFKNCRMYIAQSDYAIQLDRFRELFPNKQIIVLRFEDVIAEPEPNILRILGFLGLDCPHAPLRIPRENASSEMPRSKILDVLIYRSGLKSRLRYYVPKTMPPSVVELARRIYNNDGRNFSKLLGSNWQSRPEIRKLTADYQTLFSN